MQIITRCTQRGRCPRQMPIPKTMRAISMPAPECARRILHKHRRSSCPSRISLDCAGYPKSRFAGFPSFASGSYVAFFLTAVDEWSSGAKLALWPFCQTRGFWRFCLTWTATLTTLKPLWRRAAACAGSRFDNNRQWRAHSETTLEIRCLTNGKTRSRF